MTDHLAVQGAKGVFNEAIIETKWFKAIEKFDKEVGCDYLYNSYSRCLGHIPFFMELLTKKAKWAKKEAVENSSLEKGY